MRSNGGQVFFFIIGRLIPPHGKCHLNPQVREASDGMMEFLALTSLHSELPFGPLALADTAASQLIEGCSPTLVASPSETDTDTSARTCSIWGCAIQCANFTGSCEIPAGIENKELSSQDVISSWQRCENVTMWYVAHHILDLSVIFLYLPNQQTQLPYQDILESSLGSDNLLGDVTWRFHGIMEYLSGISPVTVAVIQKLFHVFMPKGFHLLEGVYFAQESQSTFAGYAAKCPDSLWEVFFESAGELVRESDPLLNQSVSVLQEDAEFPYLLIRYPDRSEVFVVLPDVVSNILRISLIRLGSGRRPAFPVFGYGVWIDRHDSVSPLSEEIHYSGAWIFQPNDAVLVIYSMFLDMLNEGTESIMGEVKP